MMKPGRKDRERLSRGQRDELREQLAKVAEDLESLYPLRLLSLLLMDAGMGKRELSSWLGLNMRTLYKWESQYRKKGVAGLRGKSRTGGSLKELEQRPETTTGEPDAPDNGNSRGVSMREVAAAASVCVGTASLALAGRPGVSAETARHVRTVAERLHYKPHPYVSTLMRQLGQRKWRQTQVNLAWLHYGAISYQKDFKLPWGNSGAYKAASARAQDLGYGKLEPFWCTEPGLKLSRLKEILKSRGIVGAIVVPGKMEQFSELSEITLVKLGGPFLSSVNHHVYSDNYQIGLLACSKLWRAGYRRIGLLMGLALSVNNMGRFEAAWNDFQAVVPEDLRIPPLMPDRAVDLSLAGILQQEPPAGYIRPPAFLYQAEFERRFEDLRKRLPANDPIDEEKARERLHFFILQRWVEAYRPDVILCADSRVPGWLRHLGYRVPEDIGVAHLNLKLDTPNWSGVDKNWETIGSFAVETLDHQIRIGQIGSTRHPVLRAVPGTWVDGDTTLIRTPSVYPNDPYVEQWIQMRGDFRG